MVIHPIHCIGLYHCIVCIAGISLYRVRIGGLLAGGLSGSEVGGDAVHYGAAKNLASTIFRF